MQPLVSILIPAYNSEQTVAQAIQSAIGQTWPRKEIIVVDDGSTDRTAEIMDRFASNVRLVSSRNRGLSAAVNLAFQHSQGDYIQELDADDVLASDKIERQLSALRPGDSKRLLLSSQWAGFYYRTRNAPFENNALCEDLSPAEWLLRKMEKNLYMQNATWLVSRELAEAAGPWNTRLNYDQDGEYFARVISFSTGTRFVPGTGVFYRSSGPGSTSYIGNSDQKRNRSCSPCNSIFSTCGHWKTVSACAEHASHTSKTGMRISIWERSDLAAQVQKIAAELGGSMQEPRLRRKFAWLKPLFGWGTAKRAQMTIPRMKASLLRSIDKMMYTLENSPN